MERRLRIKKGTGRKEKKRKRRRKREKKEVAFPHILFYN